MYICLLAYSVVLALGILAWWLSFDTSSPLPIGGIAGSMVPILLAILHVGCLLYKFCKRDPIGEDYEETAIILSITISASAIIGVALAAGVAAIFPNPIIGFTFIGTIIGLIAPIVGIFAAIAIAHCADEATITSAASATSITDSTYVGISQEEEIDGCITSPTVEKVSSTKETAV